MPFLRRWRGFFVMMRAYVPLGFEVGMCALSARTAYILLSDQGYFEAHEQLFRAMMHVIPQEWRWGALAAVACALKLMGFLGFFAGSERAVERAFLMRAAGWALSAVLWTSLGATYLLADPWTIGSGAILLLGVFSLGMVLAGPVMPDAPDGR